MPDVGVRLVIKDYEKYLSDLKGAIDATENAASKLNRVYTVQFSAKAPTQQELNAIVWQVEQTAKKASAAATITFNAKMGGTGTSTGGALGGSGTTQNLNQQNSALRSQQSLLKDLQRLENQTDQQTLRTLPQRQRLEAELAKATEERLQVTNDLRAAGADEATVGRAQREMIENRIFYLDQLNALSNAEAQAATQATQQARQQQVDLSAQRLTDLNSSLAGFNDEIRQIGVSRGESFYLFQQLDQQSADFKKRIDDTRKTYGDILTPVQDEQLRKSWDEYSRLNIARVADAEKQAGDRLRRTSFESSFLGELSRAETRTYGARILASEAQRAGAMLLGGGLAITAGGANLSQKYLREFRQPVSRVSRALDLTGPQRDDLESMLLGRAGNQGLQNATDQADAMRVWAEAINVTVNSSKDLLDVQDGIETGLVPQTEMISNLVKLNEGSASLDQTVTDSASIMVQFGLTVGDAAEQTKNLEEVVGLLDTAASSGLANVNDIGSSLKFFAGRAHQLNIDLPEAVASIEMLAQVGLKGSQAGRGMDQLLKSIVAPTPKAADAFAGLLGEDWQSQFFTPEGEFVSYANFLNKMADATKNMSTQRKQAALSAIGDANAVRTLNAQLLLTNEAWKYGVDYLGTLTTLRESGRAGIEKDVAILEQLTGLSFGSLSAVDSYRERLASLRKETETLYDNALIRLNSALLEIGKSTAKTVVPAMNALADILGFIANIVDKNPWLVSGAMALGGAAVLGGGGLAAFGTISRYAIDVFTLMSALGNTGGIGAIASKPGLSGFWGYNENQIKSIVAGLRMQPTLSETEVNAILGASGKTAITDPEELLKVMTGGAGAGASGVGAKAAATSAGQVAGAAIAGVFIEVFRDVFVTAGSKALKDSSGAIAQALGKSIEEKSVFSAIGEAYSGVKDKDVEKWFGSYITGMLAGLDQGIIKKYIINPAIGAIGIGTGASDTLAQEIFGYNRVEPRVGIGNAFPFIPEKILDLLLGPLPTYDPLSSIQPPSVKPLFGPGGSNQLEGNQASLDSYIADFYALDEEGKKLQSTIDGMISSSADMAAEMLAAGVPVEDIAAFMASSSDSMAKLITDAQDGNINLWQMASAAQEISKKLSDAAENKLAIQRINSGEIMDEYKHSDILDAAGLEAALEDYAKQIDDMARDLREAGVPEEEIQNLKATALDQLKAFGQGYTVPSLNDPSRAMFSEITATTGFIREHVTGILQPITDALAAAEEAISEADAAKIISSGDALKEAIGRNVVSFDDLLGMENKAFSDINGIFDQLVGSSFDTGHNLDQMGVELKNVVNQVILRITSLIVSGITFHAEDVRGAIDAELAPARAMAAAASLESQAMTSDQRSRKAIADQLKAVQDSTLSEEIKTKATNDAAAALALLDRAATKTSKSLQDSFKEFVGKLRGMIANAITPDAGLTVTSEDMALTNLGKYTDGAWEPLRRLASAASDPNTLWKDLLPEGIGVNSPEAKNYFEQVKAGVSRFDPAYSAFFPDRGKIVEGVIGDLEGEKRKEEFVTSVIKEMAGMGYDEKALEKYFADPEQELDTSISYLTDGVGGLGLATSDNTSSVRDLTGASDANTEATYGNTGALAALTEKLGGGDGEKPPPPPPPDPTIPTDPRSSSGVQEGAFAKGGLVTKPTLALIGEAGPELIIPLSRLGAGKGFVPPMQRNNQTNMAMQIGQMNFNTDVSSPSPAFVAHMVNNSQRRQAVNLGREILRAAQKEGY